MMTAVRVASSLVIFTLGIISSYAWMYSKASTKKFFTRKDIELKMKMDVPPTTQRIFDRMQQEAQVGGAGGSSSLDGLMRLDSYWQALKGGSWSKATDIVVRTYESESYMKVPEFDVCVIGGTLGIFYAVAMQNLGWKACVVERGSIAGRPQEWNISRKELKILVDLKILSEQDIKSIIGIEFNPVRVGFKTDTSPEAPNKGFELYVNDILNIGVRPDILIKLMRDKFVAGGGIVLENTALEGIDVHSNSALVNVLRRDAGAVQSTAQTLSTRLVIDCMGNASPVSRQIRGPVEPDGICVVVGSCARGYLPANNTYSDVIYTDTPVTIKSVEDTTAPLQYFWEAFPAGSSPEDRTTYLFTYMDARPERPAITEIMEDYWTLLPRYQGVDVDKLQFLRILYGMFPTYRDSPVRTPFNRVLQVGDASGIQSPLSFGGFGSLTRHLGRVTGALHEALQTGLLDWDSLARVNPYQPNLRVCWMFQRAMSVRVGARPSPGVVTDTLANTFAGMSALGDDVLRPFLQDVVQFGPLLRSLAKAFSQDPLIPLKMVPHVGVPALLDFAFHMVLLGMYTFLARVVGPILLQRAGDELTEDAYRLRRTAEEWKYGSGLDYFDH